MTQAAAGDGRRRGRRVSTSLSEINVIPLVDVMLVLLIIFMVAAPMLQKGVEVNLPTSRRADKMSKALVYVTVPASYEKDQRVYLDEESIPVDVLAERVRQEIMKRGEKEVFLRGDGSVRLQHLMDVFGRLKEGGIEKVGIVALERKGQ
jgi:biopolymer transport protein ExbD